MRRHPPQPRSPRRNARVITRFAIHSAIPLAAAALCLQGCAATAPAKPSAREGAYINPVFEADTPDPFVLVHDGVYYCYATQSHGPGFQLLTSTDLVNWQHAGRIFTPPATWSDGDHWAPETYEHRAEFWLFYTTRRKPPASANRADRAGGAGGGGGAGGAGGEHVVAVAVGPSPSGPFEHRAVLVGGEGNEDDVHDPASAEIDSSAASGARTPTAARSWRGAIDPSVFTDDDGRSYLLYSQESPRRIMLRPLDDSWLRVAGPPIEMVAPTLEWESGVVEAPTLVKRDGVYHLFYSGGAYEGRKTGNLYGVGHAAAAALRGPYAKDSRPIMSSDAGRVYAPGHQCILVLPRDQWWIVYHGWDAQGQPRYGDNRTGRSLRIDRLQWEGDTPMVWGPTSTEQDAP